ncbi:MAG: hypothetical protein GX301_03005 [Gracilibacteraceae bacterium]|jgi:DNA-binding NarL/FixJ family response regulator|nr:hypothetical protein [Gracilibacteraceae bacterium]
MINYVLLAIGVFVILAALIMIFLDKVKGEDIYFSIDVKEQEIKKVIEDADEIISELNYTSEMVVQEIEQRLNGFREELKKLNNPVNTSPIVKKTAASAITTAASAGKKKRITNDSSDMDTALDEKLSQKQLEVLEYASQGMSVTEIAKQMNIGQGEVMLILSLKNEVE